MLWKEPSVKDVVAPNNKNDHQRQVVFIRLFLTVVLVYQISSSWRSEEVATVLLYNCFTWISPKGKRHFLRFIREETAEVNKKLTCR